MRACRDGHTGTSICSCDGGIASEGPRSGPSGRNRGSQRARWGGSLKCGAKRHEVGKASWNFERNLKSFQAPFGHPPISHGRILPVGRRARPKLWARGHCPNPGGGCGKNCGDLPQLPSGNHCPVAFGGPPPWPPAPHEHRPSPPWLLETWTC